MQENAAGAIAVARASRWRPIRNERGTEPRLHALRQDPAWSGTGLPSGDATPVLLISGWMAGERPVRPLAGFLERLGAAHMLVTAALGSTGRPGFVRPTYRTIVTELAHLTRAQNLQPPPMPQSIRVGRADA